MGDKSKDPERVVKRKREMRITSYNLDEDEEKQPDYVEVFRCKNGKPESQPSIKIFKPNGAGNLEIVVADKDQEGEPGYGIPDLVEEVGKVDSGRDIKDTELMDFIFKQEQKPQRGYPEEKEINKLYIIKSGTAALESYEMKPEGWEASLPEYHSLSPDLHPKGKANKRITVQVKVETSPDEEREHEFGKIAWIALRYEGDTRVMEFYKPNEQFREKKYRITAQGREVTVRDEEGQIRQYDIIGLLERNPKPYRIDFDRNQQKRWQILDKDGDKVHYEAKKEIVSPDVVEWEK